MNSRRKYMWAGALALLGIGAATKRANAALSHPSSRDDLAKRIEALEYRLGIQEDIEAVRRLQNIYNYYNTNGLERQLLALVSDNAVSIEIAGRGVYNGKAGFVRAFGAYNKEGGGPPDKGKKFGDMLFQLTSMDVITISADRQSAKARWQVLTPILRHWPEPQAAMNAGVYEMDYVKEGSRWMISKFKYVHTFIANYNKDGTITPGYSTPPDGTSDGPTTWYHPWPEEGCLPFHFPNPVTGEFPADVVTPEHYWIGNWPGEFGKTGHH